MGCSSSRPRPPPDNDAFHTPRGKEHTVETPGSAGSLVALSQETPTWATPTAATAVTAATEVCTTATEASATATEAVTAVTPLDPTATTAVASQPEYLDGRLAQYELLDQLGVGAYAVVRRARNGEHATNGLPEFVAVKIIDVSKAEGGLGAVEQEAMILEMVSEHPHIGTLYESIAQPAAGSHCLVMELMVGGELFERLVTRGPYPEDEAAIIVRAFGAPSKRTFLCRLGLPTATHCVSCRACCPGSGCPPPPTASHATGGSAHRHPLRLMPSVPQLAELCDALSYLHGLGVVHRDVKPENICFATADTGSSTRLVDFGYAAVLAMDGSRQREVRPPRTRRAC
jgi:hypothetical protein